MPQQRINQKANGDISYNQEEVFMTKSHISLLFPGMNVLERHQGGKFGIA